MKNRQSTQNFFLEVITPILYFAEFALSIVSPILRLTSAKLIYAIPIGLVAIKEIPLLKLKVELQIGKSKPTELVIRNFYLLDLISRWSIIAIILLNHTNNFTTLIIGVELIRLSWVIANTISKKKNGTEMINTSILVGLFELIILLIGSKTHRRSSS